MSEPICARAAALEQALWDGTIRPEQETELKEHASSCAECAAIINGIDWSKYGIAKLKQEEVPVPSADEAWKKVEPRLWRPRTSWYARAGWAASAIAATAVIMISVFVALGGPLKNMFSNAVGGDTMGKNQAALRAADIDASAPGNSYDFSTDAKTEAEQPAAPMAIVLSSPAEERESLGGNEISYRADVVPVPPRVERVASITMGVENARDAFRKLSGIVASGGGQVVSSRVSQSTANAGAEARLTVRIPSAQFDGFIRDVHELGTILEEDIQGNDRTAEYSDVAGRLADKDSTIAALRANLSRQNAGRDEFRRIEQELNRVRQERDRIESTRRNLASRTDFSTFELVLREEKPAPSALSVQLDRFGASFGKSLGVAVELFGGGLSLIVIGIGAVLPWAVVIALGYYFLRRRSLAW